MGTPSTRFTAKAPAAKKSQLGVLHVAQTTSVGPGMPPADVDSEQGTRGLAAQSFSTLQGVTAVLKSDSDNAHDD